MAKIISADENITILEKEDGVTIDIPMSLHMLKDYGYDIGDDIPLDESSPISMFFAAND